MDEFGVAGGVFDVLETSIDALDPEAAHIALSEFAANVGVLAGVEQCLVGNFVAFAA